MTDTAKGLRALGHRTDSTAANEEFTGTVSRLERRKSGWDAFEVWRTRVKAPARPERARKDRQRDPRR